MIALLIAIIIISGSAIYWWQQRKTAPENSLKISASPSKAVIANKEKTKEKITDPLVYSTNNIPVTVSKETVPFDYTSDQLASMAQECGSKKTKAYFDNLVAKFSGATKTIYRFKHTGKSQKPDTFIVILMPNKAGYSSLNEFKQDFDQCYAGGNAYPKMLNDDWLLFVSSCGTGFQNNSGEPVGCQVIKKAIEPTLKLNKS